MRRNFTQVAQSKVDSATSNLLTGHTSRSNVQYTSYASTYKDLDVVKLMIENTYSELNGSNDFVTGNRSLTTFKEHRLTTQEFNSLILPKLAKEKEAIETFTTLLKQKYSINSIEVWDVYSEEERAQCISLRKALLNKRVALVNMESAAKLQNLHEERLKKLSTNATESAGTKGK